jgi:hypothetical protein
LILVTAGPAVQTAAASPIQWQWDGTVQGSIQGAPGVTLATFAPGTPLEADLTFDSNASDGCPSGLPGGNYALSGVIRFGGFQYSAAGLVESSSALGSCIGASDVVGRLVIGPAATRLDPSGVQFLGIGMWLAFGLPAAGTVGGLPTMIPDGFLSYLNGGSFGGPRLFLEGSSGLAVPTPEPASSTLLVTGLAYLFIRRRQSNKKQSQQV